MADREIKVKETPLSGKLLSGDSPAMIGENFRQLTNLRYTDTHPVGVPGMTKINTTALSSYPNINSGKHLRKDLPAESHVVVQAFNSGQTEAKYYTNTTAIPSAGDFTATELMTQSSSPGAANWSDAPGGNIVMCDSKGSYIYGGNEIKVGSFINYAPDNSFWYNHTERVQNNLTNTENVAVLARVSESIDANTMLLLHLDNNVTDVSPTTVHTVTNSNVTFSTSGMVFGTHWAVFTTNAHLNIPDDADFDLSGGIFSIDFRVQLDDLSSDYSLYYQNTTNDDDSFNLMVDTNGAVLVRIKAGGTEQFSGAVDFKTSDGVISAATTYHIAVVESGGSWYIFVDGVLEAYTSDAARAANYTGLVQIGYDGTTYLEGKIDEYRVSDSARWTGYFQLPIAAYGGATFRTYLYVGSPRALKGIKPYVSTANTTAGTVSIDYVASADKAWTSVTTLSDGTASGGVPFAQTGTISFDSTDTVAQPSIVDGIVLYWYRLTITAADAATATYYLTIDAAMQTIKDTWDGVERPVLSFKQWDASESTYKDFTTNVFEDSYVDDQTYTYAELDSMTTSDYLEIGFFDKQMGLTVNFVPTKENTTANTVAGVSYWNGSYYASVGTINDGTSESAISFAKNGTISWNVLPDTIVAANGLEVKKQIGNEVPLYYYKVFFTGAMDADVQLYYASGTPAPKTINAYKYPVLAGDSVWLLNELNGKRNRILKSVPGHADTWNGDLALDFEVGNDKDLMAGAAIYMQIGNNIYEVLVCCKRDETWMIIPTELALQKFLIDARKGCTASGTLKTASLAAKDALQVKRNVVMWQSDDAIVLYGGGSVVDVSDDIRDYFDRNKSYSINRTYIGISQAFFDENNHYHWLFASGTSTTLDKELVYDTDRDKWYEMDRGTGKRLQCGIEVQDTSGNKYSFGGISQFMQRLENGTDFDGNDIVHTLWTGDIPVAESIAHMSKVVSTGITCLATNTTTNLVQGSYYRDANTSADATFTLEPQKTGGTLATPTSQDMNIEGNSIFHSIKLTMTTDDETIGFEPMYLYLFHKIIRRKLLGGS